ncbi:tropomyosin alpha-1 chain-like [Oscarella lobularis]|uniref:tropomyosin alpha-1 chain-like n=1 Tax=Oscarella lobularis TaxID=121494 RepID=UPI003313E1D0
MSDPQLEDFVQRYRKAVKRGSASAPSTSVPPATAFLPVNPTTCRYYQLPAYQQTTPTPVHLPFGVAYPNVVYNYRAGVDSSGNRIEEVNVKQLPDEDRRDEWLSGDEDSASSMALIEEKESEVDTPKSDLTDTIADLREELSQLNASFEEEKEKNRALEEKAQMTKALWSDLELKMKEKTETEGRLFRKVQELANEKMALQSELSRRFVCGSAISSRKIEELEKQIIFLQKALRKKIENEASSSQRIHELETEIAELYLEEGTLRKWSEEKSTQTEKSAQTEKSTQTHLLMKPIIETPNVFDDAVKKLCELFPMFDRHRIIIFIGLCRSRDGSLAGLSVALFVDRVARFIVSPMPK